jgi:cytoskeletal protein RodZ
MNVTRIEVPLSEPHFEDEATVVSARQVVPLGQAQLQDRRRKLLAILPILLAAIFCGGLGAIVVNYFERRASAPTISQPSTTSAKDERQQAARAASPDNSTITSADSPDGPDTLQPAGSALATDSSAPTSSDSSLESSKADKSEPTLASAKKPSSPNDAKQLVRPRRVHPASGQNDQPKSRGAARIQDLFSGPNP